MTNQEMLNATSGHDTDAVSVCPNCLAKLNDWDCCNAIDRGVIPNGWSVERNPKPIPSRNHDFDFSHEDHDGENGLCGTASSVSDAINQIREIELDRAVRQ